MRRHLVISIDFECKNGHLHGHYGAAVKNYSGLLADTGKSEAELQLTIARLTPRSAASDPQ
jgi:hypothetical protein